MQKYERRQFRFSRNYKPTIGTSNRRFVKDTNESKGVIRKEPFLRAVANRKPPSMELSNLVVKMLPWAIGGAIVFYFASKYFEFI